MLAQVIKRNYSEYIKDTIVNRDSYKMKKENFNLWLDYLKTHPNNATYKDYKKFKKGG